MEKLLPAARRLPPGCAARAPRLVASHDADAARRAGIGEETIVLFADGAVEKVGPFTEHGRTDAGQLAGHRQDGLAHVSLKLDTGNASHENTQRERREA